MIKKRNSTKKKSFTAIFHKKKKDQFACHSCNREYDKQRITTRVCQNSGQTGYQVMIKKGIQRRKSFTAILHNKNDQFACHSCSREYDKQRITTENQHIKVQVKIKKGIQRRKLFTAILHNKNDQFDCGHAAGNTMTKNNK